MIAKWAKSENGGGGGKKHYKGPFSLKNTFGVNDFLQKTFNPKIGKFSYKCVYLE